MGIAAATFVTTIVPELAVPEFDVTTFPTRLGASG